MSATVDSHAHRWGVRHTPQAWMTREHADIARPFGSDDLKPLMDAQEIDSVIVVQGACLDSDTDYLFAVADRHEWIAAVTAGHQCDVPLGGCAQGRRRHGNVMAKVSGLNTMVTYPHWSAADWSRSIEVALDCFGPARLMCGSDWPVALVNGDYGRGWDATRTAVLAAARRHAEDFLGSNACRTYQPEVPTRAA